MCFIACASADNKLLDCRIVAHLYKLCTIIHTYLCDAHYSNVVIQHQTARSTTGSRVCVGLPHDWVYTIGSTTYGCRGNSNSSSSSSYKYTLLQMTAAATVVLVLALSSSRTLLSNTMLLE
jgi:hypothetical protein